MWCVNKGNLQVKALIPNGVQLLWHSARPLLYLSHLDCHVRIGSATFVFGNKALSADHCRSIRSNKTTHRTME